jgi:hypothetical protein
MTSVVGAHDTVTSDLRRARRLRRRRGVQMKMLLSSSSRSRLTAQAWAVRAGCIAAVLFALTGSPAAQDTAGMAVLRGRVVDARLVPQKDVAVCAPVLSRCVVTDDAGAFTLTLRPGTYTLEIAPPGRLPVVSSDIRVRAGLENVVELPLTEGQSFEQAISVTASALVLPEEVKTSAYVIRAQEIAESAGALEDVARYVQALPGVAIGTDDFRNDLIVRGGSPLENLYIVDNVEIPNINSFATFASAGGTVSMLDAELIDNVTFMTGGYPAPFGNRASSVLQVAGREGRRDRLGGRATVGFAGAGAVVEGPIGRRAKGSWIVSARRSFLDLFTDDTGIGGVPVLYTFNAKAVFDISSRDRIWGVNISGVDQVRLGLTENSDLSDELSNLDIRYEGGRSATGVNWQRTYARGVGLLGATYSQAKVWQRVTDLVRDSIPAQEIPVDQQIAAGALVFREESAESETSLKYDHTVEIPGLARIQFGANARVSMNDYDVASPLGSDSPFFEVPDANPFTVQQHFAAFQASAYGQGTRTVVPRLDVTGGARLDRYDFISATRLSPRLGAEFSLSRRLALRGSYGQYYQPPSFLFLTAYPENRSLKPFRADHYVGGIRFEIDAETQVSLETYRKTYRDYPVSSQIPALSLANIGDTFSVRDALFPMVSRGSGVATGIEAWAARRPTQGGRWSGQANLSWSRARYAGLDGVLRAGSFDYPVTANVTGTYRISGPWRLSTKMTYLRGRPYTPLNPGLSSQQRRSVYDLSRVNAERGPDYFRLDLRVDRTFRVGNNIATVFAGAQNVTNRRNFAGYSWDRRNNRLKPLEQLGLFPIVGLEWPF